MSKRPRGPLPNWRPTSARQTGIAADLDLRYRQHADEGTLPRGPRGVFYDLRPSGMGNGVSYRKPDSLHPVRDFDRDREAHPAAVQEVLVLMRRAWLISEEWVADSRAPMPSVPLAFDGAAAFAREVAETARAFRLVRQRHQPCFVEVHCEADDLTERLSRVTADQGVPVYSGAGFDGLKGKRALAERAAGRDVPTFILNVGDRDRHGEDAYTAVAEDAVAWAAAAGVRGVVFDSDDRSELEEVADDFKGTPALVFARLALTAAQAIEHDLLDADGKAEVDGLPVPVLDALVLGAICELHDPACRERVLEEEAEERRRLPGAIREALNGKGDPDA